MRMGSDPAENLGRAVSMVSEAASRGARVICLPELFRSRYFCQEEDVRWFDLAESVPGPTTETMGKLAQKLRVAIVAPIFERRAAGLYHNSAVVLDTDGRVTGHYRKMHIPDDPEFYEKFYFAPGDLGFGAFDTSVGRVGVLICWDQWYPEAARLTAMRGPEVLFYPTAIGWHPDEKASHGEAQRDAWRTVQRGHAIANGIYVAAANRVGHEPSPKSGGTGLEFWGTSFIADPQGIVLAEASTDREEILVAEADPARVEEVRRNWPFLRDRRIDAYHDIPKRFIDGEKS
jgi:N-carbamoylputrescine amidase